MFHRTRHFTQLDEGRVRCDVCPRECALKEGQRGLCVVRAAHQGEIVMTVDGLTSGFCVDPIEKKPLNHFLPGTPVLSFGTVGCNLTCKFCQNWDISKIQRNNSAVLAHQDRLLAAIDFADPAYRDKERISETQIVQALGGGGDRLRDKAGPEMIAEAAVQTGSASVAYTYNDPVIFMEYAIDAAIACKERGVKSVAVTAGYISPGAREEFFAHMDAANVDLKAFTQDFYRKLCSGHLQPVLDTLTYLKHETDVWFEITTLLIPGENDGDTELDALSSWVVENLGPDVPIHFSAFHPDWKMTDKPRTPQASLQNARDIARRNGVRHAYVGNVHDLENESTYCHQCGAMLIGRNWYELSAWGLDGEGNCLACGTRCPGVFDGPPGKWGRKRRPVRLA